MKNYTKFAFLLPVTILLTWSSFAGKLTPEWKEFIRCANAGTFTPKFLWTAEKALKKPLTDGQKTGVRLGVDIAMIMLLNNLGVDWENTKGAQLCEYFKLPDVVSGLFPPDFKDLLPAVTKGICIKGLSVAAGKCELPGSKLTENEYLLSEFSKCVASKFIQSKKVQDKLGNKAYVSMGLEGAITSGIYSSLSNVIGKKAPGQKTSLSLAKISSTIYDQYLKNLLESTLSLPVEMTDPIQEFLDSAMYTYGKSCLDAAKTKTEQALKDGIIIKQTETASLQDLKVGVTKDEKAKLEAAPTKIEENLDLELDDELE